MLSPDDWGKSCPHKFLGSYRLEYDYSWTSSDKIDSRNEDIEAITKAIVTHSGTN